MSHNLRKRRRVSYLEDVGLVIHTKRETGRKEKRLPPKLRGKHATNLEYLADGDLVWLTSDKSKSSRFYDESSNCSFFEQCFITLNKIGEGSFGSVLKVVSKEDGKAYAMKVSKTSFRNDADKHLKEHEVNYHKRFSNHPNVVTLFDAWEEDRYMYIQMELCRSNLSISEVMPENQCWEVLADIASALEYLHELGIAHFDVKVENILWGFDGLYKLGDFGLVYHLTGDRKRAPNEGDAKYVAPELLASDNFTTKADIFSLGISVLELAGNLSLPTNGPVWKALRENTFPLKHTEHISDELFFLLTKMMSPSVSSRPSAKEILDMPSVKAVAQKRDALKDLQVSQSQPDNNLLYVSALWKLLQLVVYVAVETYTNIVPLAFLSACVNQKCSEGFATSTPIMNSGEGDMSMLSLPSGSSNYKSVESATPNFTIDEVSGIADLPSSSAECTERSLPVSASTSESPVSHLEMSLDSVYDSRNIHYTSPSILRFGISPVRLSNELKEAVKARRRERLMIPRNLSLSFDEDLDS